MPVIYEEFLRCERCGCPDFKEEKRVTVHKKIRPRNTKDQEIDALTVEYRYLCCECGHELNR